MELIRIKVLELDPEYDDEINYFLYILELFVNKHFLVQESLEASQEYATYHVSPNLYRSLIDINKPELDNLHEMLEKLKEYIRRI